MTVHKHAAMIKAKVDNMDLVIFCKKEKDEPWFESGIDVMAHDGYNYEFFLCLPQHKESCLHWLNGGDVKGKNYGHWVSFALPEPIYWNLCTAFMDDTWEIKIKPRKEKRWICINNDLEIEDGTLYESYNDADENSPGYKQIVEIEVEV